MPIPPPPQVQHCPRCGWQGPVIAPKSDAVSAGDFAALAERCPRCGNEALSLRPAPRGWMARLWQALSWR